LNVSLILAISCEPSIPVSVAWHIAADRKVSPPAGIARPIDRMPAEPGGSTEHAKRQAPFPSDVTVQHVSERSSASGGMDLPMAT